MFRKIGRLWHKARESNLTLHRKHRHPLLSMGLQRISKISLKCMRLSDTNHNFVLRFKRELCMAVLLWRRCRIHWDQCLPLSLLEYAWNLLCTNLVQQSFEDNALRWSVRFRWYLLFRWKSYSIVVFTRCQLFRRICWTSMLFKRLLNTGIWL